MNYTEIHRMDDELSIEIGISICHSNECPDGWTLLDRANGVHRFYRTIRLSDCNFPDTNLKS
jgi:hypothetical protein